MYLMSVINFEQFYQPAGLMKIILFLVEFGDKNVDDNQLLISLKKNIRKMMTGRGFIIEPNNKKSWRLYALKVRHQL